MKNTLKNKYNHILKVGKKLIFIVSMGKFECDVQPFTPSYLIL
jgi:hypothetical protein